jgi:septation ring formation regulator EzrA
VLNVRKIEKHVKSLRKQLAEASDELDRIRIERDIALEDAILLPPIPQEIIEAWPEMRAMAEERSQKFNALPVDVRAAIDRTDEINEQLLGAQTQLAIVLLGQRRPIAEIAGRTGLNEDDVNALALDSSELN